MPGSTYRYWTEEEERRLLELKEARKSVRVIAKILNRLVRAIDGAITTKRKRKLQRRRLAWK